MKSFAAFSVLIASAMAEGYFGVMSTRSASPVHLLPLTARGGKFYLGGGPPSSYCPPQVGDACPPGTQTVLAGGDGTLSLGVVVPGGQQGEFITIDYSYILSSNSASVYVAPDGTLSYTAPHSAYKPEGSVVDGWTKTEGENFGNLAFKNGLIACPTKKEGEGYQVFGQLPGLTFDKACLGFNALTSMLYDS
jgi:hypothetical protein